MKIAIVAPSPYNFVMGGAEHFWLGLQRYINEETNHHCELLKIPTKESTAIEVINSYLNHSTLDVSPYDRVITSKYPSWMIRHDNHSIYMLHTLRGLYDTYHFMGRPYDVQWERVPTWLRSELDELSLTDPKSNEYANSVLRRIIQTIESDGIDDSVIGHPGPLIRHIVREFDKFAMQPARIRSYATMSKTVSNREGYFPCGVSLDIIPPPSRMRGFWCGDQDYIFTVSRLDGPKRVDLLIEAVKISKSNISLWVAGSGPDEERLRNIASGCAKIKFMGALTDKELIDAYANSLAVAFVPYDEDYGLVTVEAMLSRKPVLTVDDSGGVTEFVKNSVTGYVAKPNPEAIAEKIDQLAADRIKAKKMGEAAFNSVKDISWRPLAEFALGQKLPAKSTNFYSGYAPTGKDRRKLLVALTFPVYPPRGGGQSRVFHLYKQLALSFDVSLLCLCSPDERAGRREIAPGLTEIRIPKTQEHHSREARASSEVNWVPITDIVAAREIIHTPEFEEALVSEGCDADILVASHPFFASILKKCYPNTPLWFEAHNVEYSLKRSILPDTPEAAELLELVRFEEALAWQNSTVVFACSNADLGELEKLYGVTNACKIEVPNGFAEEEVTFYSPAVKRILKERLELENKKTVLFLGSWHGPNIEACQFIIDTAQALSEITFVVVGSVGEYFRKFDLPSNVRLIGAVDEKMKELLLASADLALNPMISGSGSNLKMLDYFASGIPVISTEFGARGIGAHPGVHYIASTREDFAISIIRYFVEREKFEPMIAEANFMARASYSWRVIGGEFIRKVRS
jgi:glycosyltransferase involved in cell wall biosynthesis